jgi:hypothetical protein
MLSKRKTVLFSLAVVGFLLALTLGDFLALHDIQQDYVSPEVLTRMDLDLAGALPYWTTTSGEWTMVSISFIARLVLLLVNALLLLLLLRDGSAHALG